MLSGATGTLVTLFVVTFILYKLGQIYVFDSPQAPIDDPAALDDPSSDVPPHHDGDVPLVQCENCGVVNSIEYRFCRNCTEEYRGIPQSATGA